MPEPSDHRGTKKTGWKAKLVFFAVLWDAKDWATTDAIVSKFQADLAKHPLQPNQAWGRSAQQLVDHYAAGHWDAVPSLLETMKANLHFAREYTRTQNIMNRHGSDARRPDWFDIRTEKATLNQCVESLATASNNHALTLAHGGQKVHNFPAYLTSQDWTLLHADVTVMDLLSALAQRLAHMSVVSLKEHTKHQAVALILKIRNDQGKPAMTPHALHQLQKDFQALHKAATQGVAPGNGTYPPRPNDLGENWLQAACGNDRPECRQISLAPWMKKAPVRNTNLLLQATQCRTNGNVPQDTVAQLAQALLQAQSHRQPQVTFATQAATSQQEVLNNRPAATPMPQALPLTNGPTEQALPLATEPAVPQQKGQPSSNTNGQTLEELEAQAYQAIASKKKTKGMKRPTKRAKLAELLQFSSNLPKHSQSALAAILDKAKKSGIPDLHSGRPLAMYKVITPAAAAAAVEGLQDVLQSRKWKKVWGEVEGKIGLVDWDFKACGGGRGNWLCEVESERWGDNGGKAMQSIAELDVKCVGVAIGEVVLIGNGFKDQRMLENGFQQPFE
ncbi:unnamed protein product [Durusdinium trenchii]|uniref:Uncharacterized protein n=1 Tax=Durusdinium trenchii TaxID=1381693 RepID=A0ABP0HA76_9DINO